MGTVNRPFMKEAVGWVSGVVTGRGCGFGGSEATNEEFKLMPRGNALQTLQMQRDDALQTLRIHRERIATHHVNALPRSM